MIRLAAIVVKSPVIVEAVRPVNNVELKLFLRADDEISFGF